MRTITFTSVFLLSALAAFADGLITKTNQSAQYVRMLSRNASTDVDAVYFNPAGFTKLDNGLHAAFSGQFLKQSTTFTSNFLNLADREYTSKNDQPFIPTVFAVYKNNNLAISFGYGQIGGNGSMAYDRGLPSLEIPAAMTYNSVPLKIRNSVQLKGYSADVSLAESSVYRGFQVGLTYRVAEALSVYGGVRILPAKTAFEAAVTNIRFDIDGEMLAAPDWLTETGNAYNEMAVLQSSRSALSTAGASKVQPLINLGAGSYTIAQVQNAGYISSADRATLENSLAQLGKSSAQIAAMNITQVRAFFNDQAEENRLLAISSAAYSSGLLRMVSMVTDKEVRAQQSGTGFTPAFGINLTPFKNLNIGVRYEMKTKLELENDTETDDFGLFPDKEKMNYEIPGMLALGVGYSQADRLDVQLSFDFYFDKGAEWGRNFRDMLCYPGVDSMIRDREIDRNSFDVALGLEFAIDNNLSVSLGGQYFKPGVTGTYQSDFGFTGSFFMVGAGISLKIIDKITFDAGFSYAFFNDAKVGNYYPEPDDYYLDIYARKSMTIAAGLSYRISR